MFLLFLFPIALLSIMVMVFMMYSFLFCEKLNKKYLIYTLRHWVAYQRMAIKLKCWRPRHLLHDVDKVIIRLLYHRVDAKALQVFHRSLNDHHLGGKTPMMLEHKDYIDAVIDWECARLTKPGKPLDAFDTMKKLYPEHSIPVIDTLKELGLRYK